MDQLLNIIEVIEGKYMLNTHQLQSALTLADSCNNIALISIVGPKSHGKTFFINCLINYMCSEHKEEWPHSEDALIQMDLRPKSCNDNITPVIKLTSSPFEIIDQIENEVMKTAVFLMDSDFVFDNEMSSQQVQDIIALFLLTSSTVIYNHKGFLPTQEFLRLKTISSRISYLDSSLESLKNIMFLIRDWSPEKGNNEFNFGLYEGSKYIENFIENIKFVKSDRNLRCCLISAPELGTQTESIKLSLLNKNFLIDLKNLIKYNLFNADEMPKKINPNTNEYINSCELFNLFENCVEILNQNIDCNLVVDSSTTGAKNITTEEQSIDETDVCKIQTEMDQIREYYSELAEKIIKEAINDFMNYSTRRIKENEVTHPLEFQSFPSEKQNISYTSDNTIDSSNAQIIRNEIKTTKSETEDSTDKNKLMNDHENISMFNSIKGFGKSETTQTFGSQSLYNYSKQLNRNIRETINPDNVSYADLIKNNFQSRQLLVDKNKVEETEIENRFKNLVDKLLIEYNNTIGTKLEYQSLDLDKDLMETHETIKQKILEDFNKSNDIEPSLVARDYKTKYILELNNKMIEAFKTCKNKAEVELKKVLKQISYDYEMNLKFYIIDQMKDDLNTIDLNQIQIICENKAFDTFKEETVNGNVETKFSSKLNIEMNQVNDNLNTLLDSYKEYETKRQQMFPNMKYYSEETMKKFHNNQKTIIMHKFKDSEQNAFIVSLLEKSFYTFKERNNSLKKEEEKFAGKAIEYAFEKYKDIFEAKLKTEFFDRNAVNNIRDQLLKYTIKQMIASCDFNEDQNYFAKYCEEGLILEVHSIHEIKSTEYEDKISITQEKLAKARKKAFEIYWQSMNTKVSTVQKKSYLRSKEFAELHHRYSKQAIESFNQSVEFLKQDYDQEFANKLLIKNQSSLRQLITSKKQNLKSLNDNNTPDDHTIAIYLGKHYVTAASFRDKKVEIITEKFEQEQIPNSISIGNEILIGSEAKNHYENLFPDIVSFQNFDIKQLLGRERSNVSDEELSDFPFSFLNDKLSVHVDYHDLNIDLSIESLLAFMILDIKLSAEKQIGNIMSNIVLTVPTNYTINQKNAVRNVANIAGFKDCDVISEISAAAINYAVTKLNFFKKFNDTILFVIINDYECDVAICSITNEKIEYKVYFHQTLNPTEEEKSNFIKKNNRKYKENPNNIRKYKFKELLGTVLKKANFKSTSVQIDECFITGNSPLLPDIRNWTINNKKIKPITSVIYNSLDIIKGSAIYGEMMTNKITFIEISEVTTHNICLNFDIKSSKGKLLEVMPKNTQLPIDKIISFPLPQSSDLPLKITVSQDKEIVKTHLINVLPFTTYTNQKYVKHLIDFDFDCFGQISIMSFISSKNDSLRTKLESIEINPGLNKEDLMEEKQKLYSLRNKIHEEIKLNEEKLYLEQAINELRSYCLNVKNEVENNVDLRPLIKKQILSELEKTLCFLSRDDSNLNEITKQKQMLDKTFEGYNYVVKNS